MGATVTAMYRGPEASVLLQKLDEARSRTDDLFAIVRPEAIYDRPIAERHRIIFYVGHLEAFDWNLIGRRLLGLDAFDPKSDQLFAFGIDPVDGGLPTDEPKDWPGRSQVENYKQSVRDALDQALTERLARQRHAVNGTNEQSGDRELVQLLHVAIEHRLMHAETLTYMLHQLPIDRKFHIEGIPAPAVRDVSPRMVDIPAGTATLGLSDTANVFGWDNEFREHAVTVPAFRMDAYNVTNQDFLNFLNDGGYQRRALWSDDDWKWRESTGVSHPAFWVQHGGEWFCRTMFREVPLPLQWPVYVSHAEASAYARWAGKMLPTEAQWHRAAYGTPGGGERSYPWGEEYPDQTRGNFDFQRWDPTPVGAFASGASAFGVAGLLGNGWEWTCTPFAPFEGFERFPFYAGYSADFFDNKHYVMKGGSSRTAASMLRRSFRNWFQPHYQYVYASFRCVES